MTQRDTEPRGAASRQRSFRWSDTTLQELERQARERSDSSNRLGEQIMREGLRTLRHPLIGFRTGPHGERRPAIVGTRLSVWQVVQSIRDSDNDIADAAGYLGLSTAQAQAAVAYYADHAAEIDAEAQAARAAEDRERDRWEREQQLFA